MAVETTAASNKTRNLFMISPSLSADMPIGFGLALASNRRIDTSIASTRLFDRDPLLAGRRAGTSRARTRGGCIHENLGHQLGMRIEQACRCNGCIDPP